MLYPIAIEPGDEHHAFGVIVPDIPGCFSAGDTLDEALHNVHEAIDGHLSLLSDDQSSIPMASSIQAHVNNPDYAGFIWAVVDIDITRYLGKSTKLNITLPASLIRRIDECVATHPEFKSRSGFLASTALEKLLSLH
jgi:predicted RNase H-like HicB family nuclease